MYLSRLVLNMRDRLAWRELSDCHSMHRRVMSAFPEAPNAEQAREKFCVLYRVEQGPQGRGTVMLVQSVVEPDWSVLPPGYLASGGPGDGYSCKHVGAAYDSLAAGTSLRFRLRANPARRVSPRSETERSDAYGRRVEIRDEDGQLAWLARKGEQHGFRPSAARAFADVPNVRAVYEDKVVGRRRGKGGGAEAVSSSRLSFGSVLFDGELVITDAHLFRLALSKGVGTGKAYGFGLLSVAPTAR